jgi:hypothetical protein
LRTAARAPALRVSEFRARLPAIFESLIKSEVVKLASSARASSRHFADDLRVAVGHSIAAR